MDNQCGQNMDNMDNLKEENVQSCSRSVKAKNAQQFKLIFDKTVEDQGTRICKRSRQQNVQNMEDEATIKVFCNSESSSLPPAAAWQLQPFHLRCLQ